MLSEIFLKRGPQSWSSDAFLRAESLLQTATFFVDSECFVLSLVGWNFFWYMFFFPKIRYIPILSIPRKNKNKQHLWRRTQLELQFPHFFPMVESNQCRFWWDCDQKNSMKNHVNFSCNLNISMGISGCGDLGSWNGHWTLQSVKDSTTVFFSHQIPSDCF